MEVARGVFEREDVVAHGRQAEGKIEEVVHAIAIDPANTLIRAEGVLDSTAGFGNANSSKILARWVGICGESRPGSGSGHFQGVMDDLRVCDRVLDEMEVATLLENGT